MVVLRSADPDHDFAVGRFGTTHCGLEQWAAFLRQHGVTEVAMESTAQYWRGVWMALESEFQLTRAQARRVRAVRGRKRDRADTRRIAKRLLSDDLTMSYVPPPEQRDGRLVSRTRVAMQESVSGLHSQIEVLLEQAQIKLSSVVSAIVGLSGRRILPALVDGISDPASQAALAHHRLRASQEERCDAIWGRLTASQRLVLRLYREQIEPTETHMAELEKSLVAAQTAEQEPIVRLCGHPGISALAAQQILAEVGSRDCGTQKAWLHRNHSFPKRTRRTCHWLAGHFRAWPFAAGQVHDEWAHCSCWLMFLLAFHRAFRQAGWSGKLRGPFVPGAALAHQMLRFLRSSRVD